MKLKRVKIENYRAIERLELTLDPRLTVFHGNNAHGKTSILSAIAVGLGRIPRLLPDVSGIGFRKTDRRGSKHAWVALTTADGVEWRETTGRGAKLSALRERIESIVNADENGASPCALPILAFYDANRAVFDQPQRRRGFKTEFPRYAALEGALSSSTDFREFFKWFYVKQYEESLSKIEKGDLEHSIPEVDAVRKAVETLVPGVSNPRIVLRPLRFVVSVEPEGGGTETLSLDQLSGGYRIVLALAADLARRMVQGNPHLEDPLQSEAVVLIDEIDLHLHPAWQQCVLPDLMDTFPNAQFIVSTHSPQVLTTVKPERIIQLHREDGGPVAAYGTAGHTFGAEAGSVLAAVMGVAERPANNDFVEELERYMRFVSDELGESKEALQSRKKLEELSPRDPGLNRADGEIRRQKVLRRMVASR